MDTPQGGSTLRREERQSGGRMATRKGESTHRRENRHSRGEDGHSGGRIEIPEGRMDTLEGKSIFQWGGGGDSTLKRGIDTTQRVWTLRRVTQHYTREGRSTLRKENRPEFSV